MGRSAAAALALAVGAPATCLTVKEDHSVLGVGTAGAVRCGWTIAGVGRV